MRLVFRSFIAFALFAALCTLAKGQGNDKAALPQSQSRITTETMPYDSECLAEVIERSAAEDDDVFEFRQIGCELFDRLYDGFNSAMNVGGWPIDQDWIRGHALNAKVTMETLDRRNPMKPFKIQLRGSEQWVERYAVNYFLTNTIKVIRAHWRSLDHEGKMGLVIHEVLGMNGVEVNAAMRTEIITHRLGALPVDGQMRPHVDYARKLFREGTEKVGELSGTQWKCQWIDAEHGSRHSAGIDRSDTFMGTEIWIEFNKDEAGNAVLKPIKPAPPARWREWPFEARQIDMRFKANGDGSVANLAERASITPWVRKETDEGLLVIELTSNYPYVNNWDVEGNVWSTTRHLYPFSVVGPKVRRAVGYFACEARNAVSADN